ncbi:MAG TPA: DinB family protein [Candidatus Angelobacter sp.]|nr:DinB family protein [Candidatus Angelobacter sp.]
MSQPLNPEHAQFLLTDIFLPLLEREHPKTRQVIEAIPASGGEYRPDPVSKTALELAWHIVAAEKRFLEGIANGEFNFAAITRPENVRTGVELGRWYGDMFQTVFPRLRQMTPSQLTKSLDFRGMFQSPAVMFFQTVLNHSVHHRGQLSVYLRPAGGKVPAIYGESYDSAEARKAQQAG